MGVNPQKPESQDSLERVGQSGACPWQHFSHRAGDRTPFSTFSIPLPAISDMPPLRFVSSGFTTSDLHHARHHPVYMVHPEAHSCKPFQIFFIPSAPTPFSYSSIQTTTSRECPPTYSASADSTLEISRPTILFSDSSAHQLSVLSCQSPQNLHLQTAPVLQPPSLTRTPTQFRHLDIC